MTRTPYRGPSRKLVLTFDIGTTYSGVAYAFLDPGEVPQIHSVTRGRYLGNPNVGSAKVPSVLYYDRDGNFQGVENGTGPRDDESLIRMRWWKLMLGPMGTPAALRDQMSTSLPKGKTIVDVFADFMHYLFDSTKALLVSSDQNGEHRWNSVSANIELVLTHPNGWGGPQQSQLRTAAVQAKIVPNTIEGHARVHFVTEGEAGFNFCATHTQAGEGLKCGDKVLVVDAGGGTIDISSYAVINNGPLQVEELFQPKWRRIRYSEGKRDGLRWVKMLLPVSPSIQPRAEKLKKSRFNTSEDLAAFSQKFDEGLKRVFLDDTGTQYIKFGSPRDNDPKHGIKAGKLALKGTEVSGFFEPSIRSTVESIREHFAEILSMNSVGRLRLSLFAHLKIHASWLFLLASLPRVHGCLASSIDGFPIVPDTNINKVAAVGAVSFYIDRFVRGRISKFTYGVPCSVIYNPFDPQHAKREGETYIDLEGDKCVPGAFKTMLSKGTRVLESREIRIKRCAVREGVATRKVLAKITKYDGGQKEPKWIDVERVADISASSCTRKLGTSGTMCSIQVYDVVLMVGLTELKAQIRWFDSTTVCLDRSSDAVIVYKDASETACASLSATSPPRYGSWYP
ncbi:hypothetical protein BJ322DRAFT_1021545 [Thelephora terrestris]|uniref:Uncharacterized protein n=1 Tax=Thelephora terrestris TaxID=56493 RepID=A0A9P6HCE4_9AGAM|nr:hypothetical protein BJ322DRAFT_1021545 [Thelephora terrestris]